jgi:hypothetical protein
MGIRCKCWPNLALSGELSCPFHLILKHFSIPTKSIVTKYGKNAEK